MSRNGGKDPERVRTGKMGGRPTKCCPEVWRPICRAVAGGATLMEACRRAGGPSWYTVLRWLTRSGEPYETFRQIYAQAREHRGHTYGERVASIGRRVERGELDPNRGRVAADAYRWTAAVMAPRAWSEQRGLHISGELQAKTVHVLGDPACELPGRRAVANEAASALPTAEAGQPQAQPQPPGDAGEVGAGQGQAGS